MKRATFLQIAGLKEQVEASLFILRKVNANI
jgi:hypothetical protein